MYAIKKVRKRFAAPRGKTSNGLRHEPPRCKQRSWSFALMQSMQCPMSSQDTRTENTRGRELNEVVHPAEFATLSAWFRRYKHRCRE